MKEEAPLNRGLKPADIPFHRLARVVMKEEAPLNRGLKRECRVLDVNHVIRADEGRSPAQQGIETRRSVTLIQRSCPRMKEEAPLNRGLKQRQVVVTCVMSCHDEGRSPAQQGIETGLLVVLVTDPVVRDEGRSPAQQGIETVCSVFRAVDRPSNEGRSPAQQGIETGLAGLVLSADLNQ